MASGAAPADDEDDDGRDPHAREDAADDLAADWEEALSAIAAPLRRKAARRRTALAAEARRPRLSGPQRLLLLDTWRRSGLAARDFSALVGVSAHTLYKWSQNFAAKGPAGLEDAPQRERGTSRLPEPTKRAILLLKETRLGAHLSPARGDALHRAAGSGRWLAA
ncbi:MAG: hypothetical protein R3F49_24225 [Planctomycetota bacterium]